MEIDSGSQKDIESILAFGRDMQVLYSKLVNGKADKKLECLLQVST